MSVQQLVSKCLSSPGLRDEIYCQILRQISTIPDKSTGLTSNNILQGWFLLALIIPLFLPTRKIFSWYLEAILLRASNKNDLTKGITDAAVICHQRFVRAEKKGSREKTPSWFEMHYLMSGPIHLSTFILSLKLKLPVNLMNDTTLVSACFVRERVHVAMGVYTLLWGVFVAKSMFLEYAFAIDKS